MQEAAYNYQYDNLGNRWQQNLTAGSGYNSLWDFTDGSNQISNSEYVTYDKAGNITWDDANTYTYDAENRIISLTNAYGTYTYAYDAMGRRVEKTVNGASLYYLFDVAGREVTRVDTSVGWVGGEVYAGARHLATYGGSTTTFDHADWLGTERARTSVAGGAVETCQSLPFGDGYSCAGGDVSPLHFTGKEHDAESDLENFGARYYNSRYARFVTPDDPFADQRSADPQSWNLYAYVRNNPVSLTDPDGRACVQQSDGTFQDDGGGGQSCSDASSPAQNNMPSVVVTAQASNGVTDADRFNAVLQGMQMATPGVNLAANGLRAFGYAVAAPLMIAAECAAGADSCTTANVAMAVIPEVGALREGAMLLKEGAEVGKAAEILQKGGGMAQAAKDFESLQGAEQVNGSTKVKTLADGTKAVLYESKGGAATLALQDAAGRTITKIRY